MRPPSEYVLGISAFYHDSAACLLRDGDIVAAAQEERFTRKKGDAAFPHKAISYCLGEAGISRADLSYVGFYDKPILKFDRILESYLGVAPRGFSSFLKAGPLWIKDKLFTDAQIRDALDWQGPLLYAEHHESHAASAFYPSPFREAAILTIDGVGEWTTTSYGIGRGNELDLTHEIQWPDSLGLLYSAFTYHTGFKVNSGEYKIMGLAPYGERKYVQTILDELIDLKEDGSFKLNQRYFNYLTGLTMTSSKFSELFGPPRVPETNLTQREMDMAASVQAVCEEIMLRLCQTVYKMTGQKNLCLAGGVALNCVANGRILREGPFENIWIQPAAGDAGGALGVAQLIWHRFLDKPRETSPDARDSMKGALLGPSFGPDEIEATLQEFGATYERVDDKHELMKEVAELLADEKIIGWFNGRMEFGPRALGSRSILGDPRSPRMQAQMNIKIKFREGFRPFAPSVLRERVSEYFDLDCDSPYMLLVAPVAERQRVPMSAAEGRLWGIDLLNVPRSSIPAVTHVDYSARVQTVTAEANGDYYDLIRTFEALTGCPVVVNTSFNVRGEPIVCTPADAYRCFMRTHIDALVLGPFIVRKEAQKTWEDVEEWQTVYQLD